MQKESGIYRIVVTRPGKPERYYIGQASDLRKRRNVHLLTLRKGIHKNERLQRAFKKYGAKAFSFEVVLICRPIKDILTFYEQAVLNAYCDDEVYNLCRECVDSCVGIIRRSETKAKIGAGNKGKTRSVEHRDAVRRSNIEREVSQETRAKMSAAHAGNKNSLGARLSEERKSAIAVFFTGTRKPAEEIARRQATRRAKAENQGGWFTPEARKNLDEANRKRRGSKLSPEHRAAIAAGGIGRKVSEQTRAKMSKAHKGRVKTQEHRAKISKALRERSGQESLWP